MKYRGKQIDPATPILGIKRLTDGRFVPFIKDAQGLILAGTPRNSRDEAEADIEFVIEIFGPARVYTL